jgi:hypothetical protein
MLRRFLCSTLMALLPTSLLCGVEPLKFDAVVQPFLKSYCIDCHSQDDG